MLYKKALFEMVAIGQEAVAQGLFRLASAGASGKKVYIEPNSEKGKIVQAEITKHPNALFFRAKAIEANKPNSNGDYFSEEELLKGYKSFEGVPFFTNHDNQNIENARGKIIFAEWIPEEKAVYTISFVDRDAYPHICRSIEEEYVTGVSMGAISAGTMITLPDLSAKPIEEINEGEMVLSHLGNSQKVLRTHCEYLGKPMYEFGTATYHKSPLFTGDHPVFSINKEAMEVSRKASLQLAQSNKYARTKGYTEEFVGQDSWRESKYLPAFKEAQTIEAGDYILVPSKFNLDDKPSANADMYYIYGAFLGDGYLKKDKKGQFEAVSFCFGLDEIELTERITKTLKKYSSYEISTTVCQERNGIYLNLYDRKLATQFSALFGTGSKTKRIKTALKHKSEAIQLLCGYLDTDGCIVDKTNQSVRGNKFGGFQISSVNIELLEDIQSLLIALGYVSRISTMDRIPSENSVVNVNTTENTLSIGSNAYPVFANSIKYASSGFIKNEIKAGQTFITNVAGKNFMACPIKNVKKIENFDEPVYDLTIENDESYIADGVAVHNCSVEYSVCNICGNKAEKTDDYCFVPGTTVTMEDLSVKNIEDIKVGDKVLDAFGKATRVTQLFVHEVNETVQKITSKAINGELICTSNHPFLVERRGELRFVPCEHLQEKETLLTPIAKINVDSHLFDVLTKHSIPTTEENKLKLSKLIGYFVSEGCILRQEGRGDIGIELTFHVDEIEYINEVINICETTIGKKPEVIDRSLVSNDRHLNRPSKCKSLRIYNKFIVDLINASCTGLAKEKTLSMALIALDKKYLQEILAGYIDGDGYSDKYGRLILTTASRNLAHQLMYICNMFGVPPSIYSYLQNGGPNNRDDISFEIFRVSIANLQTLPLKNSSIKAQKSKSIAKTNSNISRLKNAFSTDGFVKHTAYDIEEVEYAGPVYNFETETHSYVANNTSVHNCSHIRNRKGRKFTGSARNVITGEVKEFRNEPVFEFNYGLKFIELSAVVDPACPTCKIQGIIPNSDYTKNLNKLANLENAFYMVRTSALEKKASKEEVEQIESVLKTLEDFAVNLIKKRKQVEPTFAGELVEIMTKLQEWLDELVGAGYGNVDDGVPGTVGDDTTQPAPEGEAPAAAAPAAPQLPPSTDTGVAGAVPAATEQPLPAAPAQSKKVPGLNMPKLPITAPLRPRANVQDILMKAASLSEKITKTGDDDMGKRRTIATKNEQIDMAKLLLSNSWKEKQTFFEYISGVPSLQDNESRLSVKKRGDSFIIVAEKKSDPASAMTWTYEDLSEEQKTAIKDSPKKAANMLLDAFSKSLTTKKEGANIMTDINKTAGVESVNKSPDQITERQLDQKGLFHSRTGTEAEVVTQAQLESVRKGTEQEVVTEAQLKEKIKLHPRLGEEADQITERQLDNFREEKELDVITQKQLDGNRTGTEQDVITEKQLNEVAAPWARAASRNPALFKSAAEHLDAAINVMADTAISSGCTPDEICTVASKLVDTTKNRYDLATSILETTKTSENINFADRLAFWNNRNLKVASTGTKEIANMIVSGLRKVAADKTINPDVLINAVDVIGEGKDAVSAVTKLVDQKMADSTKVAAATSSIKDELRTALKGKTVDTKEERDTERAAVLASVNADEAKMQRQAEREVWGKILNKTAVASTKADTVLETNFAELGCQKTDPSFKKNIVAFTKGALASNNLKMAAITNVTISGDTIQIAVQTDEGQEAVEIPVGENEAPMGGETMPEGDLTGEGLENTLPEAGAAPEAAPAPAPAAAGAPLQASAKKMQKVAQAPMGGGMPGTPGGVAAPGAPEQGLPGNSPQGNAIQALTEDNAGEAEGVPTIGEQQMPWTLCPECGSADAEVSNENGDIKGKCNNADCGAEWEAMVKREVEYKLVKFPKSMSGEGKAEGPEEPEATPEVPALPVAASIRLDKNSLVRMGKNKEKHGNVCPACGKTACKANKDENGHTEFTCDACHTDVTKDVLVSASNPDVAMMRVAWDLRLAQTGCKGCDEKVAKFASKIKVEKLLRNASANVDKFPMANCIERIARKHGGNTVGMFGPCKGKVLAECVCKQLQKTAMTKVGQLMKLAEVSMTKDPMDECLEDQQKKGHDVKEASTICGCLKKQFASQLSDNIFAQAFAEDIKSGKEKSLTISDLVALNDALESEAAAEVKVVTAAVEDEEIGAPLPALKEASVEVELVKEAQFHPDKKEKEEKPKKCEKCDKEPCECKKEEEPKKASNDAVVKEAKGGFMCEKCNKPKFSCKCEKPDGDDDKEEKEDKAEKPSAKASANMDGKRILKTNEEVFQMASTKTASVPKFVEHIETEVEAGVPRKEQYLGKEQSADSMINKTPAKPNVPRSPAYMGKEKEADSMINSELKLPDVAQDSSYMGHEQEVQSGMPAIENKIKGTVIANDSKVTKEAKQMKEVETVEKDVEAKVPRSDAKMGEESKADSHINTPNKGPDVPRSEAYMGKEKEADSMINESLKTPDVPIDSAYMGHEKEVQKGMPAINDEYLKQVRQQRDDQMTKIAAAREKKANQVVAWLVANKRIEADLETFESAVSALSNFEIDRIASVADKLFPARTIRTASTEARTVEAGHTIPAIVLESKQAGEESLTDKLSKAFTIGNSKFDKDLTWFSEK